MTVINNIYLKKADGSALFDMGLDYGSITSNGQSYTFVGTKYVEAVYVRPRMVVDFSSSLGGVDRLYLEGSEADYSFALSSNSSLLTITRGTGSDLEKVVLSTGSSLSSDMVIFGNGAINVNSLKQALLAAAYVPGTTGVSLALPGGALDGSMRSGSPAVPGVQAGVSPATEATVYTGVGGQVKTQGPTIGLTIVGSKGVDIVYVADGSQVDATSLLGGQDLIYMRGAYADYAKTVSANGFSVTLTRDVVVDGVTVTEKIVVAAGTTASTDRLVFVDGSVTASEVKGVVLGINPGMALESIPTYDGTLRTPGVATIAGIEITGSAGGVLDSSNVTWLNAGDELIVTVSMSETVSVDTSSGVPRLRLNISGVPEGKEVFAVYDAARSDGLGDASKLSFVYTVEQDLTALGNICFEKNALQLTGGVIHDLNGDAAAIYNAAIGANEAYLIDTAAEISSASIQSMQISEGNGVVNGYLNTGEFLSVSAQMSEITSFADEVFLILNVGGQQASAAYDHTSADGMEVFFSYQLPASVDLDAIGVVSAELCDVAGNKTQLACTPLDSVHGWAYQTGWGAIDALGALNALTNQALPDLQAGSKVPWWQSVCNINDLHSYGYTGTGITIAVIDTGLNGGIQDFTQRISSDSWNFVSNNSNVSDDNGHGTFVASEIISANNGMGLTGASYGSSLMVLKALGADGKGLASDVVDAIYYAVDHGAQVINLSLGGGYDDAYLDALQYAYDHDVLVIMATGNKGAATPLYPAAYAMEFSNCLAVGALQFSDGVISEASFSNQAGLSTAYGYVAAPGVDISGYYWPSTTAVYTASGTSMAAPLVASVAALVWSAAPDASASDVARVIYQMSHSVVV